MKLCIGFPSKDRRRAKHEIINQRGFTLIEVLLVVVIIGALALTVIPYLGKFVDRARVAHCIAEIDGLERQIHAYWLDNRKYPANLDVLDIELPVDAWDRPYVYLRSGTDPAAERKDPITTLPLNPTSYDLYSLGKDGLTAPQLDDLGAEDDIVRTRDGGIIALASEFF